MLKDAVYAEIEAQERGSGGQIEAPVLVAPPGDVVAREAFPAPGGGSPPVEACSVGVRSPPPPMRPTLRAVGAATWEASGTGATCLQVEGAARRWRGLGSGGGEGSGTEGDDRGERSGI